MTPPNESPSSIDEPDSLKPNTSTETTQNRHKSLTEISDQYADKADSIHRWSWADRLFTGRYRNQQFSDASGRVLDVACGTGTNFPYLPKSVDLVGIDISQEMLDNARTELDRSGLTGSLHRMDAQDMEFPTNSFDTVISALSTCTFPDPINALQEMSRVCKPDGRILLLEHGRSDVEPIARFQDWRADAHYRKKGCRWNQEPLELVQKAGLPVISCQDAVFGIITQVEATPLKES